MNKYALKLLVRCPNEPRLLDLIPMFKPNPKNLAPGAHGFHVHKRGNCGPSEKNGKRQAGLAAGEHFNPHPTGKVLAVLTVNVDDRASQAMTAAHLKLADVKGHSIIICKGGDNFADAPKPLGGGDARVACGVI